MSAHIAVIDDEADILDLVALHLTKAGYKVSEFPTVTDFRRFINLTIPDLIVLDLMLPDADGMEVCKFLKNDEKFAQIPIIMLTARADETDRVIGLELGADDYVTKPFSPRELVARVKAVLRRGTTGEKEKILTVGPDLEIDPNKFTVTVKGEKISLTATEFKILHLLAEREGWVYSRDQILDHLWGHEKAVIDRTVDVHVKHIRDKIGPAGALIKNVRGVGYKMEQ